jgi:uncharacterized protein YfaS (alpha-2-macroglobulin family)
VTVFFPRDVGSAGGGPEDRPERFVKMSPSHPGAFAWLDARTLQFRPAEAWPPLARFRFRVEGADASLLTMMTAPKRTEPAAGAAGLPPVEAITLSFSDPMDPKDLARMVTIELRPLPGVPGGSREKPRILTDDDFRVKVLERPTRDAEAGYVLALRTPIPEGLRATVRLRLSLADDPEKSFAEFSFGTAEPFRIENAGTAAQRHFVTRAGSRYPREKAINGGSEDRRVLVLFSAPPRPLGYTEVRNLVRFSPALDNLSFSQNDSSLYVWGSFAADTVYKVTLSPTAITDVSGRPLDMSGASEFHIYFPRKGSFLRLGASQGVVERFGPRRIPVEGRGQERMDLRIYPVAPLDRSYWPFPPQPVVVDESPRPPGPGEEPSPFVESDGRITVQELSRQIRSMGSPPVSRIVTLPFRKEGGAATFGFDLSEALDFLSGKENPGHYIVGIRRLDASSERMWMRIQVTDLCLTAVEEPRAVRFLVTSLSSGAPVAGANVRVEGPLRHRGSESTSWAAFAEGTTDASGVFHWGTPGNLGGELGFARIARITIRKDADTLVLDPTLPPPDYSDNHWRHGREPWLEWTTGSLDARGPKPERLLHIFTERPVYRPEDEVYIKGYLRERDRGALRIVPMTGEVVVEGPGDLVWRYPVTLTAAGSFHRTFAGKDLPTGEYTARLEGTHGVVYGKTSFRMEAYRIPEFEVELHGPDKAPLDRPFEVSLTASYYAGGRVSGRPVQWRVTQYPEAWTPKKIEGFLYSSDGRYSRMGRFQASPRLEKQGTTDEKGSAVLTMNPSVESTIQPRSYFVEATVTGADDQTVTATRKVLAVPPFVLGLKSPRYLDKADKIDAEVIVAGPDGNPMAGVEIIVRLLHRQWHSVLKESDFSDGVARYATDVVDVKVSEVRVTSTDKPLGVSLPLPGGNAGVYVVEIEGRDRLGRAQVVAADLYAGGEKPVTWAKPVNGVFTAAPDKASYDPGDTATIVLKSPFRNGRALVIVEAPEKNRYEWIDVQGGAAVYRLPLEGQYAPKIPVHFVLMRGRIPGPLPAGGSPMDLGKPATVAATAWIPVNPVRNRVAIALEHPGKARPGQKIEVTIRLSAPGKGGEGRPLPGEVTLWLVDQAVLALGKPQPLDPLPDFITPTRTHLVVRDTRNNAFGLLPFTENPGGDEGKAEESPLERATIRRKFKSVPYYNPALSVGPDGIVKVTIELPDNLTNFKIRAKAVSGSDRFGYAQGQIAVRLPVIAQPALPRFVRPGDSFTAAAIGRVVEGEGGPGKAEVRTEGIILKAPSRRNLDFTPNKPERIEFPVEVPTPPFGKGGAPAYSEVAFQFGVERVADGAKDAFEVKLPVRDDRQRVTRRLIADLKSGVPVRLPDVGEPARPGSVRRTVFVSEQAGLVRMAAGLDFLLAYPYGCTEQRISQVRARMGLKKFRDLLHQEGSDEAVSRSVRETLSWIHGSVDPGGLVAYWPGSPGNVSLTAWALEFLVEARAAGFPVDRKLEGTLSRALEQALRSDYGRFIDGESFTERTFALSALASAGKFSPSYGAELARRAKYLNLESVAKVSTSFARAGEAASPAVTSLSREMWDGLIIRLFQGRELYGGLQDRGGPRNGLILPSETRTLAEVTRALSRTDPKNPRFPLLVEALVTLGRGDGWGTTNANAAALLALAEILKPPFEGSTSHSIRVTFEGGGNPFTLALGPKFPTGFLFDNDASAGEATLLTPNGARAVALRAETTYLPLADGSRTAAEAQGFVVSREVLRYGARPGKAPPDRVALESPGIRLDLAIGDMVEDHVRVVNPQERHYVAVVVPLAAGMETLNPNIATAPPEAKAAGALSLPPTYVAYLDDQVAFYYNTLPKGTYDFYFRTRATTAGRFIQPAARAEMMYDGAVRGNSAGARVEILRKD